MRLPDVAQARRHGPHLALAIFVIAATFAGWKLFWFLTDDAFIAFRYISNEMRGFGLTWNPPPFRPVEGYTSFLWVVILELIWRVFGVEPPQSANWLSLALGYGTMGITYLFVRRLALPRQLDRHRMLLTALAMIGILTNRTFLAWLSSGLETTLFNFCAIWWAYLVWSPPDRRGRYWVLGLSTSASLTALARPDGLLFCGASLALVTLHLGQPPGSRLSSGRLLLQVIPFLAIPAHFAFRFMTYGEWLPNTYFTKYVAAWPASGMRYLASFVLEYGLWVWVILSSLCVGKSVRRKAGCLRASVSQSVHVWIGVAALAAHAAYYTFVIGGDHFEYRVYSHLIPLLFILLVWLAGRLTSRTSAGVAVMLAAILVSWPIPWVHWMKTRHINTRHETVHLAYPIAGSFPRWLQPVIHRWDAWQFWLIDHSVCVRHQEHKVFYQSQIASYPSREKGSEITWAERGIGALGTVGVPAWVLPEVAIIDMAGLNDRVIAHRPVDATQKRQMAHERRPPPGYIECFRLNLVYFGTPDLLFVRPRKPPLTDDEIRACESQLWY